MEMRTAGKPSAAAWLAFAAGIALALPVAAQAAFPGANGRIAYTVQQWRPPPPPEPPWYEELPVPVSMRIETALPSGQRRRVLHTFTAWRPGYYGDTSTRPSWSPSGRLLAFGQGGRLAIMRDDGRGLHQLPQLTDSDSTPAWSPDGLRLAFFGMRTCLYCWSLDTVRSDGTGLRRVVDYAAEWPAWSVKGSIAFLNNDDQYLVQLGPPDGLYSISSDGSRLRRLFGRLWGLGTQPDWSPDGRRLAFNARGRIFTMTANGRGLRRLTENYPRYSHPAWSPDGKYIALVRRDYKSGYTPRDKDGLYVIRSDGSGLRRVVEPHYTRSSDGQLVEWEVLGPPSWQPLRR
jgi:WD40 repeat protein